MKSILIKSFIAFLLVIFSSTIAYAQLGRGVIKGEVNDAESGKPLPFATVILKDTVSNFVLKTTTDFEGVYTLKPIKAGEYNIEVSYGGYHTDTTDNIIVKETYVMLVDITMQRTDEVRKVKPMAPRNPNYKLNSVRGEKTLKSYSPDEIEKSTDEAQFSQEQDSGVLYIGCGRNASIVIIEGVMPIGKDDSVIPDTEEDAIKLRGVSACYENKEAKFNRDLKYLLY